MGYKETIQYMKVFNHGLSFVGFKDFGYFKDIDWLIGRNWQRLKYSISSFDLRKG